MHEHIERVCKCKQELQGCESVRNCTKSEYSNFDTEVMCAGHCPLECDSISYSVKKEVLRRDQLSIKSRSFISAHTDVSNLSDDQVLKRSINHKAFGWALIYPLL